MDRRPPPLPIDAPYGSYQVWSRDYNEWLLHLPNGRVLAPIPDYRQRRPRDIPLSPLFQVRSPVWQVYQEWLPQPQGRLGVVHGGFAPMWPDNLFMSNYPSAGIWQNDFPAGGRGGFPVNPVVRRPLQPEPSRARPTPRPKYRLREAPRIIRKSDLKAEDVQCPICYRDWYSEDVDNGLEVPVEISCGHMYGSRCLDKWIQDNDTCPTCRAELDRVNYSPALGY